MMTLSETLVHMRILLLDHWMTALLFLSACSLTGQPQYHSSPPEVVIPLRVTSSIKNMSFPHWLSYSLHFGGHRHIIYVKPQKFLFSRHFSVFTYTDQGVLIEDHPFVKKDCYYQGYVEEDPESIVAINTCYGGFQGTIQINETTYEIKPKSFSSTFEHLVYRMDSEEPELPPMRCGLTEEEIERQLQLQERYNFTLSQSSYEGWWLHSFVLEFALVIDNKRFVYRNRNASVVQQEVLEIVSIMNIHYTQVELSIIVPGIEIWTQYNFVNVEEIDMDSVLSSFCVWKRNNLDSRLPHDVVHLLVRYSYDLTLGIAYIGSVCVNTHNCGVDGYLDNSAASMSQTMAHELGHNFGMLHDRKFCTCGREKCLMAPDKSEATKLSNCSYAYFVHTVYTVSCLYNMLDPETIFKLSRCGNAVVEDDEECDCGSLELCAHDECCTDKCTLKFSAQCTSGLCCKDCKILPSGTVCREMKNECDLPEWCNGTSNECPEDVQLQDGTLCMDGGYCYGNRCNNRDAQCRGIFGQESRSASQACYHDLNIRGDRFGNCGLQNSAYLKCAVSDVLCGRIQCENLTEIPALKEHYTLHFHYLNNVSCWSTDFHFGMTIPDIGEVQDGTECGQGLVCFERKCVNKSVWLNGCSQHTCNMKGVCNNKYHCHCEYGWSPPTCLTPGTGGSIDSGPPPQRNSLTLKILIMSISFSLILLVLIIGFFLVSKHLSSN